MSADRVIPARRVDLDTIESFPYFAAQYSPGLEEEGEEGDDAPLSSTLTTPEEDARRLASVDQIIYQKMQQAERDAHDVARRAYEEGFQAGETEGRAFGETQYRAQIQRLDGALQDLSDALALGSRAAQDEILALALAMAEYLAEREIREGAQTLRPLLDAILEANPFPGSDDPGVRPGLTVLVHPRDLELMGGAESAPAGVFLREDEGMGRGSLRVEGAAGVLDATVERRRIRLLELIQRTREKEGL
jgi:flagellar assembly protein FliH